MDSLESYSSMKDQLTEFADKNVHDEWAWHMRLNIVTEYTAVPVCIQFQMKVEVPIALDTRDTAMAFVADSLVAAWNGLDDSDFDTVDKVDRVGSIDSDTASSLIDHMACPNSANKKITNNKIHKFSMKIGPLTY